MTNHLQTLLSIKMICELINRDRRTLWVWVRDGRFPQPLKHNGRTLGWTVKQYDDWLESLSAGGIQS